MKSPTSGVYQALLIAAALALAACASDGDERYGPSETYQETTVKTKAPKCPTGYVLTCESKPIGRIRFGRIGNKQLDSCACEEYRGMPTQSPVPGIQ